MGGIGGVRVLSAGAVAPGTLREMADRLRHRGPDGSGTWIGDDVGLVHARLALVDGDHGRQPLLSADERWALVLDGEILNHRELRARLDYPFRTQDDAEVVLAGLAISGIAFVEQLRGQFAFVAHDRLTGTTHLVRDRLGILPLHYRQVSGGIAFASEVKALLAVGPPPRVDHSSLDDYFGTRSVSAPHTLFEGVKKVRPAHRVAVGPGGHFEEVHYWTPPECDADGTWNQSDAIEAVGDGVREAVRSALAADAPVGAHLSGELGCSLVVAQMRELRDEPLHTFSVGFGDRTVDGAGDDVAPARRVAELLGTRHHEVLVQPHELEELWTRLTWHRDAPIGDLADVAAFGLARAAREHVGVIVSGHGADELFGGHGRYRLARLAERSHALPPRVRTAVAGPVERRLGAPFGAAERHRLLGAIAPADRRTHPTAGTDPVDRMLRHDLEHELPDILLERVDRMSKAASVEIRPALLDHRLVELAFRLPSSVKVRSGSTQWVLREVARPLLPDGIIDLRRTGSRAASTTWLHAGLRDTVRERLLGPGSWVGETLDRALLEDLVDRAARHDHVDARLWTVLALETWHACFLGDAPGLPHPRGAASATSPIL